MTSLKEAVDEISYASTADSDEGSYRLRAETDSLADRSPSSMEGAGYFGTPWDFGISAGGHSPTHAGLQAWQSADFYVTHFDVTPHTNPCGAQAAGMPLRQQATTTMLRNIPQRFDRESLLENLVSNGFGSLVDFLYMPNDFSTGVNLGYAFINFVTEDVYMQFKQMYHGVKLAGESPKVCQVCDAKVQGKNQNVEFYRNSTVMSMDARYHPMIFENGLRQPFPQPTRPLGPVIWKSSSPKNTAWTNSWAMHSGSYYRGTYRGDRRREARYPPGGR